MLTILRPLSTQIYSLFDDVPPRPAVPLYRLPDCYHVTNIQPIDTKIGNFNEETLFWIFYSCPQDVKQQLAAVELCVLPPPRSLFDRTLADILG
jgi:CCR4-NOT transcription complex subunit 2